MHNKDKGRLWNSQCHVDGDEDVFCIQLGYIFTRIQKKRMRQ